MKYNCRVAVAQLTMEPTSDGGTDSFLWERVWGVRVRLVTLLRCVTQGMVLCHARASLYLLCDVVCRSYG
jgi:hypothetical protein